MEMRRRKPGVQGQGGLGFLCGSRRRVIKVAGLFGRIRHLVLRCESVAGAGESCRELQRRNEGVVGERLCLKIKFLAEPGRPGGWWRARGREHRRHSRKMPELYVRSVLTLPTFFIYFIYALRYKGTHGHACTPYARWN